MHLFKYWSTVCKYHRETGLLYHVEIINIYSYDCGFLCSLNWHLEIKHEKIIQFFFFFYLSNSPSVNVLYLLYTVLIYTRTTYICTWVHLTCPFIKYRLIQRFFTLRHLCLIKDRWLNIKVFVAFYIFFTFYSNK